MAVRLVYHTSASASGGVSPFDEAVLSVAGDGDVRIACPYISLSYLKRIVGSSDRWRVLTDVEEWLASQGQGARLAIYEFVSCHNGRFRHIRGLHAKAIIGGSKALIGSANFTGAGITRRQEIAVLFEDEPQVAELQEWFDTLWLESSPIDLDKLQLHIHQMHSVLPSIVNKPSILIPCRASPVRSRLKRIAQSGHIGPLSVQFVEDNLDSIFVAYSLVYVQDAIDALEKASDAEAIVIQPYERKKAFISAGKAARLYKGITRGRSIPILITPQGRMSREGQRFQYGARLWDILDVTDDEQLSLVKRNLDSGKWVLAAGDSLYSEKNLLIIERPIVRLPEELPVGLARNIRRGSQGSVVKAVSIPAPKLIDEAYTDILEML